MKVGPEAASIEVFSFKEGLFSAAGHDLALAAERFTLEVSDDERSVRASIEAASLRVVTAMRHGRAQAGALTAHDRASIERSLHGEILEAHRFPEVRFESTAIEPQLVRGTLTLHGTTRALSFPWRLEGDHRVAEVDLDQREFGIAPFKALMGALKVKPHVRVRVRLPLRAPQAA